MELEDNGHDCKNHLKEIHRTELEILFECTICGQKYLRYNYSEN